MKEKKEKVARPKKPTRDPADALIVVSIRLPPSLVAEIDRRVALLSSSIVGRRSAVVREALETAFKEPK